MSENRNRAFMYGESVFTTMRMSLGKIHDWDFHVQRLLQGVEFIYGPFTDSAEGKAHFVEDLRQLTQGETGDKILRLTVYLEQERGLSLKSPLSWKDLKSALFSSVLETPQLMNKIFSLRSCRGPERPAWWPSFLKAGNYLETILLQKKFLGPEDDDLLFTGANGEVLETSVANIFFVNNNKLYTPPAAPQVLAGVMRKKVLESADEFFESCHETAAPLAQVLKADAVFGTNSVRGPFLIGRIDDHRFHYSQDFLDKFDLLRKRVLT